MNLSKIFLICFSIGILSGYLIANIFSYYLTFVFWDDPLWCSYNILQDQHDLWDDFWFFWGRALAFEHLLKMCN